MTLLYAACFFLCKMFAFDAVSSTNVLFSFIFILLISQNCRGNLPNFLDDVETEINSLATKTLRLYRGLCSVSSTDCSSAFDKNSFACSTNEIKGAGSYCSSNQGSAYYTSEPGCTQCENRRLNRDRSLVRTASSNCTCQDIVNADVCWTKGIDDDLKTTNLPGLLWQQIATTHGFTRLYPGSAQEECHSYDPRLRSWFVAASAGPKDVVILIDSSASMSLVPRNRQGSNLSLMQLAKRAVAHVLRTLTFVDYIAVAKFSTESEQVTVNEVYTLIQATRDNVGALIEEVNNIQPEGHTNFEQAFRLAFRIFERSASVGRTTGCNKAVLFMTDGSPTRGEDDPAKLAEIVDDLNTRSDGTKIASIFTYSISEVAEKEISKHIACSANGVWSEVETGTAASLQEQLSQYYEYFSTLHKGPSGIIWTEPYLDSFGADMVITAAKAVYDSSNTSQSKLVAVVAIDISYAYIQELDDSKSNVMAELQRRQEFCPNIAVYSECELEVLRQKVYTEGSVSYESRPDKICGIENTCPLPADTACPNRTFQYDQCTQHSQATQDYKEAACCGTFLPCPSSVPTNSLSPLLSAALSLLGVIIVCCLL
ncbi:voltage-dependent calcium channel subunit alpha-2/delta-1-like [Acanthaster planci]|uniref:Voltage-dependent calcium channel subunit alpha-2/delta-1-like n=1 Tax=Acanthaster planci TaxID=133434 RepID=A0A8B7ZE69_ACAPL|nr:voltage-dependent calcium channel subunit alpha-2/delta-1-like [Acanthaster planci]